MIQFRPLYEELKSKYYGRIKDFAKLPHRFTGVDNKKTELLTLIPDQNSQHLQTVYMKAEELFDKL